MIIDSKVPTPILFLYQQHQAKIGIDTWSNDACPQHLVIQPLDLFFLNKMVSVRPHVNGLLSLFSVWFYDLVPMGEVDMQVLGTLLCIRLSSYGLIKVGMRLGLTPLSRAFAFGQ